MICNTLYNAMAKLTPAEFSKLNGKRYCGRKSYRLWRTESRKRREHLSVNITTTLKCNARCPCCYEHGVKQRKKDQPVKLNWFGGEPLLNPKIIDAVTKRPGESGLKFTSFAITNGSLITRRLIARQFKRWNLREVQITLDETATQYAKRKGYVDGQRTGDAACMIERYMIQAYPEFMCE